MPNKARRIQRKANELGRNPKCQICGEKDITMLVKAKSSLMEKHHIAGHHEGEEIIVCRNCHARLTNDQLDLPEGIFEDNRTPEMKAVAFFLGIGSILALLSFYCMKHAMVLYDFFKNLGMEV